MAWWSRKRSRGVTSAPTATTETAAVDQECAHLATITDSPPSSPGCEDCIAAGQRNWVHLRMCRVCGHVGCCNNSPGLHATAHYESSGHAVIQSYEPGQDWLWCYADSRYLEPVEPGPSPSHP